MHHNTNLIKMTNKVQLYRIIYYSFVPWLLYMFRVILSCHQEHLNCNYSFWFHSHVLLSAAVVAEPRQQPTATHVNELYDTLSTYGLPVLLMFPAHLVLDYPPGTLCRGTKRGLSCCKWDVRGLVWPREEQ